MAVKKTQLEKNVIYFCTFTCIDWLELITISDSYDAFYKWFEALNEQGNSVTGYVIMPNHFHGLIYISPESKTINKVIANAKRFLTYEIIKRLKKRGEESVLCLLQSKVNNREREKGYIHRVFKPSFDAKVCYTPDFIAQKLNYIHNNPNIGKWNLVDDCVDYFHSSAKWYELGKHGPFEVTDYRDIVYFKDEVGGVFENTTTPRPLSGDTATTKGKTD